MNSLLASLLILPLALATPELPPNPQMTGVEAPVSSLVAERRQAVMADPDSATAWGHLGMALDIHDFEMAAEECYERALELDPESFRWAYFRALTLAEMADPRAAAAFERARAINGSYTPLLVRFGDLLFELGRVKDAEQHYETAIEADGDGMAHAFLGLARLAVARADLDSAVAYAEQSRAADPGLAPAQGLLAEIYRRRGELKKAAEARRDAEEIRGPTVLVDALLGELMADGVSSYWHHERGQFLLASRQPERAEAEFRAALALSPHALFYENLARALLFQKRGEQAQEALRRALELTPDLASSHLLLGRLYARSGRRDDAIRSLRRAAELRPDSPAGRELGYQLMSAGERAEGIRWLESSLATDEEPRVLLTVAFFYATTPLAAKRDAAKGERLARHLLDIAGERAEAYDVLGASLAAQARFDEAVEAAERALRLASGRGSPLILNMRQRLELYRSERPFVSDR